MECTRRELLGVSRLEIFAAPNTRVNQGFFFFFFFPSLRRCAAC